MESGAILERGILNSSACYKNVLLRWCLWWTEDTQLNNFSTNSRLIELQKGWMKEWYFSCIKILYGVVPEYVSRRFTFQNPYYATRKSEKSIHIPRVKTNYGKRRLGYRGAVAWNNLTTDLKARITHLPLRKN